jgi:hypothetical protein
VLINVIRTLANGLRLQPGLDAPTNFVVIPFFESHMEVLRRGGVSPLLDP